MHKETSAIIYGMKDSPQTRLSSTLIWMHGSTWRAIYCGQDVPRPFGRKVKYIAICSISLYRHLTLFSVSCRDPQVWTLLPAITQQKIIQITGGVYLYEKSSSYIKSQANALEKRADELRNRARGGDQASVSYTTGASGITANTRFKTEILRPEVLRRNYPEIDSIVRMDCISGKFKQLKSSF